MDFPYWEIHIRMGKYGKLKEWSKEWKYEVHELDEDLIGKVEYVEKMVVQLIR